MEPEERAHRPSADDGDDPVDPLLCEPCKDVIGPIELLDLGVDDRANAKGIAAGGCTEDAPVATDQLLHVSWLSRTSPPPGYRSGKSSPSYPSWMPKTSQPSSLEAAPCPR